ncbi:MAG: C25 family cysteine peptidase [bacterium]
MLLFLFVLIIPALSQAEPYWVAFYPEYPVGTPPIITVQSNSTTTTVVQITVPGMWVEDIEIDGIIYQKLELPEYSTLSIIGLPALPTVGGFVGFLEMRDTSIEYTDDETILLENYNVFPFQEPTIDNGFDNIYSPFDIDRNFYNRDAWYPIERVNTSETGILRDLFISYFGVVPFEYNAELELLKVHPIMTITIYYNQSNKGGYWGKSSGDADPTFVPLYEDLIINYDWLGISEVEQSEYDYLIVTHPNFLELANKYKEFLEQRFGFRVYVSSISTNNWHDVYNLTKKFYLGYHNDYVLLIGNEDYIPIPYRCWEAYIWYYDHYEHYEEMIPSDIVYAGLCGDDRWPEVFLGRLSVNSNDFLLNQMNKIKEHYDYGMNYNRMLKSLLVAHFEKNPLTGIRNFIKCKTGIMNKIYHSYTPSMFIMNGTDGWTNNDIINYINENHPMIVNYRGHGEPQHWWKWNSIQDFGILDINLVNPGNERPVVFSITCYTGFIDNNMSTGCFCEHWMNVSGGAVGVIGATRATYNIPNDFYDECLYNIMYDRGNKMIGSINDNAKLQMMRILYKSESPYDSGSMLALRSYLAFLLLGDPTLQIVPPNPYVKNIIDNDIYSNLLVNKNNLKPNFIVYPNPTYESFNIEVFNINDRFDIKLYDISGRLIQENINNRDTKDDIIKIDPSDIGLRTGIYFINITSKNIELVKRLLYIK